MALQGSKGLSLVGCNPRAESIYSLYSKRTDFTCLVSNICSRNNISRIFFLLYYMLLNNIPDIMEQNLCDRIRVHVVQILPQRYRAKSQLPAPKIPSLTPVLNQSNSCHSVIF